MNRIKKTIIVVIVMLVIIIIYRFNRNKQFDSHLTSYKPVIISEYENTRNIREYQAIQANFLLDTLTNKSIEEFIFNYSNDEWGDTMDCNFIIKIVFDNEKKAYSYLKKEYVNFKHQKILSSSYTLTNPSVYGFIKHYFIYFKPVKSGLIKDSAIIHFLSDSIYQYKDRKISSTGIGYFHLVHLKEINDTLKFYKYDLTPAFDEESKRLESILNLIKEETSK